MDERWPEFTCEYQFEDSRWSIGIPARDAAEASRRLRAIGMTGEVRGEIVERVPAYPGAGLYVRLRVMALNLFGGRG